MKVYALKIIVDMTFYFSTDSGVNSVKCSGNLPKGTTLS
ncbi:hypothetical protein BTN49_2816 [Candidatus Enterovibrio escicola]|uniref:Uncharacterized protein n=1 Tax=Candidatus Enterovibrio escicola TaxID=1927127 RepID=A0A2A5T070_9GAMM|nr:hypothetical protein BTN49_2816 [Candidatus Enterovibrio escacola]